MYGHSSSLVEDCIIIIGGLNSTSPNSYVLQYNITNNTWDSLETFGGTKPTSKNMDHTIYICTRYSHIVNASCTSNECLLMYHVLIFLRTNSYSCL